MAIFKDTKIVQDLFGELWTKMINETEFGPKLKEIKEYQAKNQ